MERRSEGPIYSKYGWFDLVLLMLVSPSIGQLTASHYDESCPNAQAIVRNAVEQAHTGDSRIGASLIRLHFHDCFVTGCDGSILLDDKPSFIGEKTALPNANSTRGFEVIDDIKTQLENECEGTVSCSDILAMAARDAVVVGGGPSWTVLLGRRDSTTASFSAANNENLPSSSFTLPELISFFERKGLSIQDMVILSGAHTMGQARCSLFSSRLFNFNGTGEPDPTIEENFLGLLQEQCPQGGNVHQLQPLDIETPTVFDNQYYKNLEANKGLLNSDQILYTTSGITNELVKLYASSKTAFFTEFKDAMIKMGSIDPLTGTSGEIRKNCRMVNS